MNLLSLSYGELAQQLRIPVKSSGPSERRFQWAGPKAGSGAPPEATMALAKDQTQPENRSVTVVAPRKAAAESVHQLETRIAILNGQMAALQDELGKAEALALAEQYNVVQERKKAALLRAEVHRLTARLRDLQQTERAGSRCSWWKRLLAPRSA